MRVSVVGLALIGACDSLTIAPCYLRCGANNGCPDDLVCNVQGMCASEGTAMCSDVSDDLLDVFGIPGVTSIMRASAF